MNLVIGNQYTCEAVEIRDYGAIMKMEDRTTQLLHISNISDNFVKSVADYISVGSIYTVTAVPGRVKDIEITLRDPEKLMNQKPVRKEENFEDLLEHYLPSDADRRYKRDKYSDDHRSKKNRRRK